MNTQTAWNRHDLLGLEGLGRDELVGLLDRSESLRAVARGEAPPLTTLAGRVIAHLFFEASTRTRCSYAVAAARLGATCIDLTESGSSRSKGETLLDTARTVDAMGVDAIVIRVAASGGPALIARHVRCSVLNAGDGRHEHPTQALLDLLTLRQRLGDLAGKRIAIVGDIASSRVARSNLWGLTAVGAQVLLVGPPPLVPMAFETLADGVRAPHGSIRVSHDLDAEIASVDAIMMLRVQFERGSSIAPDYRQFFGLTAARAARLGAGVPVLHPGPMNRGLEIDSEVADDLDRSVILDQVANGVAVRMAVLARIIHA